MIDAASTFDSSALLSAAQWVEVLIQGPLATGLAALAIAALGFALLRGHIPVKRGATATLGCFVLLGAPAIAYGIVGIASDHADARPPMVAVNIEPSAPIFEVPAKPKGLLVSDPYAGASVAR